MLKISSSIIVHENNLIFTIFMEKDEKVYNCAVVK